MTKADVYGTSCEPQTIIRSNPQRGNTYLVVNQYADGRCIDETPIGRTRTETVDLIATGQYEKAVQVYCINIAEGTFEDVSAEIAELCLHQMEKKYWPGDEPYIPSLIEEYCSAALGEWLEEIGMAA